MAFGTIDFEEEMSQDFLDYCYQTNVERAFPAIDGLKPGQRACLFEMFRKGYLPNKPHVKSAKVTGGVIAELWPHGDTAIYETFARMSQTFVNNSPLCEFHGSNGTQIIPEAAAPRYTEVRLSKLGLEMFEGIKKENVPFILNFDETIKWPAVLPSPLPMLMINGSEGIGTTIAQKWLPYDAKEVSNAYMNYLKTGEMDYTLAPSFPTGGIIINKNDVDTILKTGKGKVILRARADIKDNIIIINEICYQTCVRDLMEDFQKLFNKDELPGVSDIQNLSGKKGIHIEITCDKNANPAQVLNMLYQKTDLQKTYNANQNILIDKIPQLVNTETYFKLLYKHNDECLIKEYTFEKNKSEIRKEECEGLILAIANIDDIISIVKESADKVDAKVKLIKKYNFTDRQTNCILKMTIGQLTKLDENKIKEELQTLINYINNLSELLNSNSLRKEKIINNINTLIGKYKSERKTELTNIEITKDEKEIATITPEDVVVIMTKDGMIKKVPTKSFKMQKRGGKGIKTSDIILDTIKTNTVDTLMLFSNNGKMYRLIVDQVPSGTNASKGVNVKTLIKSSADEEIIAITSLHRKSTPKYIVFITKNGMVKKSLLSEYTSIKKTTGIIALTLKEDDGLSDILFMDEEDLILVSKMGNVIRFETNNINAIGRVGVGVKGIKLNDDDSVIAGMPVHKETDQIAVFAEKGYGKRMELSNFPTQGRGGKGNSCYKGVLVGAAMVSDEDAILVIGNTNSIMFSASELPSIGRLTQGNTLIKNNNISSIVKI